MARSRKRGSSSPDAEELKHREAEASALSNYLKSYYEKRNQQIKELRELRFMERKVYVPPSYGQSTVEIRTPLMNDLVQRLAGALSVNPPQFKVPPRPRGDQSKAQRNSSLLEKWTTAVFQELEHQENDRLFYRFLDYLCGDGHGIIKVVHRPDFWEGYPTLQYDEEGDPIEPPEEYEAKAEDFKTGRPLPFSVSIVDPLTFYPFHTERGLERVFEISKRPRVYVSRRFNVGFKDGDVYRLEGQNLDVDTLQNLNGSCEYWEDWTKDDVAFFVDKKCVEIVKHNMGRIPYFEALGTQTSSRDPDKEGLSVGHQLIHLVPALDSLLTMKTNAGFLQAYPTFKRIRPVGAPARFQEEGEDSDEEAVEFEPGHIYDGMPGEDLMAVEIPPVGPDLNQSIEIILGLIGKVGVPSVLEGSHSPNRVSGYAYSEMLNVSRTKYTTIIRNASFAIEGTVKHLWWLVEHRVGEQVPVWGNVDEGEGWLSLGPDDINGYYRIKAIIEPLLPEDDIAQGQHAAAMVQAGMWSKKFARESKMGIPQPEEMDDEILVERALEMPQVQMYILMKALEELEMDELKELFQLTTEMVEGQLAQAAQEAGVGGTAPGQAGVPNVNPGTGGAGMPGAQGMLSGGMPKQQPPVQPTSPI